jgi:NADH-quinone oxidoreductase subunit L
VTIRFAERLSRLGTESAFEVLAHARMLEAEGRSIVHLEIGEPDFATPDNIIDAAVRAMRNGATHYTAASGIREVREKTAAYVTRLWLMTFFDVPRGQVAAHESSPAIRWPLLLLAVPAALIGFVGVHVGWLPHWLDINQVPLGAVIAFNGRPGANPLHIGALTSVLSVSLAVIGFVVVLVAWRRAPAEDPTVRLVRLRPVLGHAFYVDELYDRLFVGPVRLAARSVRWTDDEVVTTTVAGSGHGATRLAGLLRRTQQGNVQTYLTGLLAGVVLLAVGVVTLT